MSIDNLYKNQGVLEFKNIYALEKIHGTSAHIRWEAGKLLTFFSGGAKHASFVALFDPVELEARFVEKFGALDVPVVVYGEAYGGKEQGMSPTYGKELKFVAFDVKIGENWLAVPKAVDVVQALGLEFVDYTKIPATLEAIDAERDKPSTQALRNGIVEPRIREGVVLRPPFEVTTNGGHRVISKHKRDEFKETNTPRVVTDPTKARRLDQADEIAQEWVTEMRLEHVIGQLIADREHKLAEMSDIPALIALMQADIIREAVGEIVESKEQARAVGAATVKLFKRHLNASLEEAANA